MCTQSEGILMLIDFSIMTLLLKQRSTLSEDM